jgi:hypothetical protein
MSTMRVTTAGSSQSVLPKCYESNKQTKGTALFWVITQRVVVISYRRFGTTYRPRLLDP